MKKVLMKNVLTSQMTISVIKSGWLCFLAFTLKGIYSLGLFS